MTINPEGLAELRRQLRNLKMVASELESIAERQLSRAVTLERLLDEIAGPAVESKDEPAKQDLLAIRS